MASQVSPIFPDLREEKLKDTNPTCDISLIGSHLLLHLVYSPWTEIQFRELHRTLRRYLAAEKALPLKHV